MELSRSEKLSELERLLQSRTFQGAESLRAFLRFVVEKTVDGEANHLKEYTIATEVFGRSSNYDSRTDSFVRVQAGRLRTKLQEYYTTEGKQDKVVIDLPKGHYTPIFSYIEPSNGLLDVATTELSHPSASSLTDTSLVVNREPQQMNKRLQYAVIGLVALTLLLGSLSLTYFWEARNLKSQVGTKLYESADAQTVSPIWGYILQSPEPIYVAFSNTRFEGTAETGMKLLKPLDSAESSGSFENRRSKYLDSGSVITDHYTGIGEVMGVYYLADLFYRIRRPFQVRRSLSLTWEDLKTHNTIFLGSPAENFILREQLPQTQDFLFKVIKNADQPPTFGIENTKVQGGEQSAYFAKQEGPSRSEISEDYAVISLLRIDESHKVLILAGITTYGTQAAAEYVSRPEYVNDLISHLNTAPEGEPAKLPPYYQLLIKVKVNDRVPVKISYVTHHVL